jgi:hypothetical protein
LVFAACSDDLGPLSTDRYAQEADEICQHFNDEREDARDDLGRQPTRDEITRAVDDVVIPSFRDQLRELRGLELVDPTQRARVAAIWDDYAEGIDEFARAAHVDVQEALAEEPPGITRAREAAADFGMEICSAQ